VRQHIDWLLSQLTPAERGAIKFQSVTYQPASSQRDDAVSLGVLKYLNSQL
jgi:hypothetical protein